MKTKGIPRLHYLPRRGYLKNFADKSGKFFRLDKSCTQPIDPDSPKHACSVPDLYRIQSKEFLSKLNTTNEYIVEDSFWYERAFLRKVFGMFEHLTKSMPQSVCYKLAQVLIDLKIRNVAFRNVLVREREETLERNGVPIERLAIDDPQAIGKINLGEIHNYHVGIYGQNSPLLCKFIERAIVDRKFEVLIPKSKSDFVVTSDNPGYSVTWDNQISNSLLANVKEIFFPISSKRILKISSELDEKYSLKKEIRYRHIGTDELFKINLKTLRTSNENIFCESKAYLEFMANFMICPMPSFVPH